MLGTFNLTILKVETLDELPNAAVKVLQEGKVLAKVEMTAPSVSTVCISDSLVQLKMVNSDLSVSFDVGLLQPQGLHLVQLFEGGGGDKLEYLDKFPPLPRILLDIHPQLLTPLPDLTESSEFCEDSSEKAPIEELSKLKNKNIELMLTIIDLESTLVTTREKNQIETEEISKKYREKVKELSEEIEKLSIIQVKNKKISSDILKENELLKEKLSQVTKEKEDLNDELQRYIKLHKDSQMREDSIISILEFKDKEILRMHKRHSSENFKTQKLDSIKLMQKKTHPIKTLNEENESFAHKKIKFEALKNIHEKIEEDLKELDLKGILQLSEELIYSIGNKKVAGLMKKDSVYVRFGTCLRPLESFLLNNCAQEVQAFKLKRKRSESKGNNKKLSTQSELEKIEDLLISKTFDSRLKAKMMKLNTPRNSVQSLKSVSPVSRVLTARNLNIC